MNERKIATIAAETWCQNWLHRLQCDRVIAVIRTSNWQRGYQMAEAAIAGGINIIEIAWNSDRPDVLIATLRRNFPHCLIGVGTILEDKELQAAIAAGGQFIFSPHLNLQFIQTAIAAKIPIIPGALTPTEIITAWQAGATCVKVFPIQIMGGANYIKTLKAPLGKIPLIPTGGVTLDNAASLIEAGAIAVGLSSQLFPKDLILAENWQAIAQQARILKASLRD